MKPWDVDVCTKMTFMVFAYHEFQLVNALSSGLPMLNAASAGDIPNLGKYGAINLEVRDEQTLRAAGCRVPENYKQGSVFQMPFEDESFKTVVLGEFLEHCTEEAGNRAVKECARVLRRGGSLVITLPLDGRPNGHNRPGHPEGSDEEWESPHALKEEGEWSNGVTVYHQTWWSNEMLHNLREKNGFEETSRVNLLYLFVAPVSGWGLVWKKR